MIDPADMEAVLETGIPDLNKSMGTSLDGKNITPATLVADITSDYEWIYANYEGFEGDKDLNYIHASNQYQDFAAKLRFMYGNLGDYFDHAVSYPWVGYLFTGMTPDEVQELAAASIGQTTAAMPRKPGPLPWSCPARPALSRLTLSPA